MKLKIFATLVLAVGFAACGTAGGEAGGDAGADTDADADTDTDTDSDTDTDPGSDAGPETTCGAQSPAAIAACVEEARIAEDLAAFSIERPPGSAGWAQVQAACAERLEAYGFEVALEEYGTGVNVVGRLPGAIDPGEEIVVGAHYDHVAGCAGADDNASGVAGALEAARVLSGAEFAKTLVVACWDEEEEGKVGSEAFVAAAAGAGTAIGVALVFEMIGYASDEPGSQQLPDGFQLVFPEQIAEVVADGYRGDFVAIVADEGAAAPAAAIEAAAEAAGVPGLPLVLEQDWLSSELFADLRRSDHDAFWQAGYPAIMLTDTADFRYAAYHCVGGEDVPENLDPAFAAAVVRGAVAAAAGALQPL